MTEGRLSIHHGQVLVWFARPGPDAPDQQPHRTDRCGAWWLLDWTLHHDALLALIDQGKAADMAAVHPPAWPTIASRRLSIRQMEYLRHRATGAPDARIARMLVDMKTPH